MTQDSKDIPDLSWWGINDTSWHGSTLEGDGNEPALTKLLGTTTNLTGDVRHSFDVTDWLSAALSEDAVSLVSFGLTSEENAGSMRFQSADYGSGTPPSLTWGVTVTQCPFATVEDWISTPVPTPVPTATPQPSSHPTPMPVPAPTPLPTSTPTSAPSTPAPSPLPTPSPSAEPPPFVNLTLSCLEDGYTNSWPAYVDTNYGSKTFLKLKTHSNGRKVYTGFVGFRVVPDDADATNTNQLEELRALSARGYPLTVESATLSLLALRTGLDTVAYNANESFFDSTLIWSNEPALRRKLHRVTSVVEGWTNFNVTLGVTDTLAELSEKGGAADATGYGAGTNYTFGLQSEDTDDSSFYATQEGG